MSDRSEQLHQHQDMPADLDRLDHFMADLRALLAKYERPDREVDLSVCELCSLEKMGKIAEKF
jgi:hypothetical protein